MVIVCTGDRPDYLTTRLQKFSSTHVKSGATTEFGEYPSGWPGGVTDLSPQIGGHLLERVLTGPLVPGQVTRVCRAAAPPTPAARPAPPPAPAAPLHTAAVLPPAGAVRVAACDTAAEGQGGGGQVAVGEGCPN